MKPPKVPTVSGVLARCLAVLIAANAVFLAIRLGDYAVPKYRVANNLRAALADGTLGTRNYSPDLLEGIDQYTDCVSLQLVLIGNEGPVRNALAPRLLSPEGAAAGEVVPQRERCLEVKEYLEGGRRGGRYATYTRFWHGQASVLAAALAVLPLDGYRALLLVTTLALIALAAVLASLEGPAQLLGLAPLFVISFFLGGQVGFGQLLSYGPAQVACWAVVSLLLARQRRLRFWHVVLSAVLAGCLEAFLDQMISVPLVAGIFVIVATAVLLPRWRSQPLAAAAAGSASIGAAWGFGFGGTYVLKLALTTAVLGWTAVVTPFLEQLRFRTGVVDPGLGLPAEGSTSWVVMIGRNVVRLGANLYNVGYTDSRPKLVSAAIAGLGMAGWAWAAWRAVHAVRQRRTRALLINGAGYLTASVLLLAWVAAFPEHTWRHAFFMARSAVIWLVAGWGWALTDYAVSRRDLRPLAGPARLSDDVRLERPAEVDAVA